MAKNQTTTQTAPMDKNARFSVAESIGSVNSALSNLQKELSSINPKLGSYYGRRFSRFQNELDREVSHVVQHGTFSANIQAAELEDDTEQPISA